MADYDYDPVTFHALDRLQILNSLKNPYHSSIRYQSPQHLLKGDLLSCSEIRDNIDLSEIAFKYSALSVYQDSLSYEPESPGWLNTFYKTPYHFFQVKEENFYLTVDPLFSFGGGEDFSQSGIIFQNTRGLKIQGVLDKKVYFYSSLFENQRHFLNHIEKRISRYSAIPGQGFYKPYNSGILKNLRGWDYLNAQGYFGFKLSQSIDIQLGHGNNFIGNGLRSLLLSDYSHNYFYLKTNSTFWKIHYQTLFAELAAISSKENIGNELLPKKYIVAHYLDINVTPSLSLGLFESIVFGRNDHFELQYLNPVILYRTIEQVLDSPDNALLGLNISWIIDRRLRVYGQLLIDELRTDELFSGNGWWGNKVGLQLGGLYVDFLNIDRLDVRLEYNTARPYTYSHRASMSGERVAASYSHYNQPLAHPLGANFQEFLTDINYSVRQKLFLNLRCVYVRLGDSLMDNVGSNILLDYQTRAKDFGNFTTQGEYSTISLVSISAAYQIYPNYFAEIQFFHRNQTGTESFLLSKTNYIGLSLKANMFNQILDH